MDYSRPGSSVKQHYHRMDKALNITVEENEAKENNLSVILNNLNAPSNSDKTEAGPSSPSSSSSTASSPDDNTSQDSSANLKSIK